MIAQKTTFHRIERERPAPFRMVLRWPRVTLLGPPQRPRPADRGGTPGPRGPTDARPPPPPRRGASRSPRRAPARSQPGVWRLGARLPPGPRRPPHAQGALGGGESLTRPAPARRGRLGGLALWRLPGTPGPAGGPVRPPGVGTGLTRGGRA